MRIAVVGSGVSGCLVARLLASEHDVTLFESANYAGGHANTVPVEMDGKKAWADTGFMVFNERTYPNFCRVLDLLGVESQASDMSFSVRCDRTGLEFQGSSLNGVFAQRSNLLKPSFYKLLADILRFSKAGTEEAVRYHTIAQESDSESVGQFLNRRGLGKRFIAQYLVPMAAAIWSSQPEAILDFPARFMIGFFHNHGLMQLKNRPIWRTIVGGSRIYLDRLLSPINQYIRLNCPVQRVYRNEFGVRLISSEGEEQFDQVVFACHSDQALKMLADPTDEEVSILSCLPYQANEAVLHTDVSRLPCRERAWASWNYRIPQSENEISGASVTYDLNRLQNLGFDRPLLLTLNDTDAIDPSQILKSFIYHHPAYDRRSIDAQKQHHKISSIIARTHFCGAYWGYGFHEDGVISALKVASHFGFELDSCTVVSTKAQSATVGLSL
ncbi:MAG: FAD-dependent oxidoreductase [Pirellulales bacterium]